MATGFYTSEARADRDMIVTPPRSRARCSCGCKGLATHFGTGNHAVMIKGCELFIRRWVRDGPSVSRVGK